MAMGTGLYLRPLPFDLWELKILKMFNREFKAIIASPSDFHQKMKQESERVDLFIKHLSTVRVALKPVNVCRMFAMAGAMLHLGGILAMRSYPTMAINLGTQLAILSMSITYFIVIIINLELIGRRYFSGTRAKLIEMQLRRERAL